MSDFHIHPQLLCDCHHLGQFKLCHLLLHKNASVPWFILVPQTPESDDLLSLPPNVRKLAMNEAEITARFLKTEFAVTKINFAAIGNVVPQLHLHVVGRRADDPCWPAPIWGNLLERQDYSAARIAALTSTLVRGYSLRPLETRLPQVRIARRRSSIAGRPSVDFGYHVNVDRAMFLKEDSRGQAVVTLQKRLKKLGFDPGRIDGDFGPATKAAVIAFQKSRGLLADGVAGPRTLTALKLRKSDALPSALRAATVAVVSKIFPFTAVENIRLNLPYVLTALRQENLVDKPLLLMALATIRAEAECFEPICEGKSKYNTSPGGHPYDLYDLRTDLGNGKRGDGDRYKGRGFIQLTGRSNYQAHGRAMDWEIAWFKTPIWPTVLR